MPSKDDFYSVLSAAVDDLTENGFDSIDRVERWARLIRIAAERSLVAPESLEERLREGLASIYRKMVENNGLLKFNPGIERFTFERLKPALRPELDRRIMASANLIRLNRDEAIDATIRRFQGWATSVPPGGVSGETRAEVRKNVRKGLAQLPFTERRILVDQGHKLIASISEIVASDGGAIAGKWRSHWRQPGYNYRPDHRERDEKIYLIRDSWAHRAGLVKPGKVGYYDDVTAVGQEVSCRCYMIWSFALRDLPEDMLTAKGKKALASVQGMQEVRAARKGRADAVEPPSMSKGEVNYLDIWPDLSAQCQKCSMFLRTDANAPGGHGCSLVIGPIARAGHCDRFEAARADALEEAPRPGVGYQAMRTRLARLRLQLEKVSA